MRFSESFHPIYPLKPGDHNAGVDCDSFNLGLGHVIFFQINCADLTGDAILYVYSGATAGVKTTAETFNYRLAEGIQGAASADLFGDWATSAGLTLTAATYDNKQLIVEVEARALTDGQPYVTMNFSSAASGLNLSVSGMIEPRYPAHDGPTTL